MFFFQAKEDKKRADATFENHRTHHRATAETIEECLRVLRELEKEAEEKLSWEKEMRTFEVIAKVIEALKLLSFLSEVELL